MTTGHQIFEKNTRWTLRNIGMQHLDPAHGAAVETVRWCMAVRGRPTHHRQAFLEAESPALLAYLETVAGSDTSTAWRTLEERVRFHAETLRTHAVQPCARPWLAAIWHTLPELAGLGQRILDRQAEKNGPAPDAGPVFSDTTTGTGGDGDNGSAGKSGSATASKPRPSSRLALRIVPVMPTPAEEKALDLRDAPENTSTKDGITPDGPETDPGKAGPKQPGAKP
ncbi:MAG TPA: hypothetical protein VGN93_03200 [Shinella sp.]|jgi:hypothetical protein|uniref:hypothetical protein n=1 Tax=Shinella sp. TaxID=1870904 RepID=UPI002E15C0CC|nr:hypothetical protein [Shinella sp.]